MIILQDWKVQFFSTRKKTVRTEEDRNEGIIGGSSPGHGCPDLQVQGLAQFHKWVQLC